MSRPLGAVLALLLLGPLAPAADAAPTWQPPQAAEVDDAHLRVAPDGTVLAFVEPLSGGMRLAVRPPGGPLGTPETEAVPLPLGATTPPQVVFDAAGNALAASRSAPSLTYRPTGGTFGTPVDLSGVGDVKALAMAATGEALVVTDQGSQTGGRAFAHLRAADGTIAAPQPFSAPAGPMQVVGAVLEPDGAMLVVLVASSTGVVYQARRPAGAGSFEDPVAIPPPGGMVDPGSGARLATSRSGHAVLAYKTGPVGSSSQFSHDGTRVAAAARAPGGLFGTPQVIAESTGSQAGEPVLAVDEAGDGLVLTSVRTGTNPCNGAVFITRAFALHAGAFAETAAPASPAAGYDRATSPLVVAAGDRVAVALAHRDQGDCATTADDRTELAVRTFRSAAGGLVLEDDHTLGSPTPVPSPGTGSYVPAFANSSFPSLALGANGTLAAATEVRTSPSELTFALHVREDPDVTPDPDPDPEPTGTPAPTPGPTPPTPGPTGTGTPPGGTTPPGAGPPVTPPAIRPLVAKDLVTPPGRITGDAPKVGVTCPAESRGGCLTAVAVYTAFGALPKATAAKAAKTLGSVRATVPAGTTRKLKIKLTKAGRRAVKRRKASTGRLVVSITAGGRTSRTTAKVRLGRRR